MSAHSSAASLPVARQGAIAARNSKPVRDMSKRISLETACCSKAKASKQQCLSGFYGDHVGMRRPRNAVAMTMKRRTTSQQAIMACKGHCWRSRVPYMRHMTEACKPCMPCLVRDQHIANHLQKNSPCHKVTVRKLQADREVVSYHLRGSRWSCKHVRILQKRKASSVHIRAPK